MVAVAGGLLLAHCAGSGTGGIREVRQFHLRSVDVAGSESGLVRAESQYRLHGAVTRDEQKARLGRYYTVVWRDTRPELPAELVFEYRQGGTQSKVLRKVYEFPAGRKPLTRKSEFAVTGREFQEGGEVLAWRVILKEGGKVVGERTSYLWR